MPIMSNLPVANPSKPKLKCPPGACDSHNPERLVWGSDWPHINYNQGVMPDDGELLDLLLEWVPDEQIRHRILVDNACKLYDFPAP